jgi:hypothetical protein
MKWAPVADEIYKQYLADVTAIDLNSTGDILGSIWTGRKRLFFF